MAIGKEALGAPPRPHGPSRIRKSVGSRVLRVGLALGAISVGGFEAHQHIPAVRESVDSLGTNLANRWNTLQQARADNQFLQERSLGPQQGETAVPWWKELSAEEIESSATLPDINQIGEKNVSTVSPDLQEKAKQAGYKLIYQGDSSDTVGRTVVTKDRQTANKDWSVEDQGFGRAGTDVRGIFKAWVPDPEDHTQKDHMYALVVDPITKKETLVRLELKPYDPNNFDVRPTWFLVDDLYNGPSEIARRSKEVGRQPGQELTADGLPSPAEPPMKQSKKLTDFPTLNDLLRQKGLTLTDLAEPGDYVKIGMQTAGVDYTKGINTYKTDKNGVSRAITFGIRRFGGEEQWQTEIQRAK